MILNADVKIDLKNIFEKTQMYELLFFLFSCLCTKQSSFYDISEVKPVFNSVVNLPSSYTGNPIHAL